MLEKHLNSLMTFLFGTRYTPAAHRKLLQFLRFCMVGVSNTVVYYAVYALSLFLFDRGGRFPSWSDQAAHLLGFASGVLWAFFVNRVFVFRSGKDAGLSALLRFCFIYVLTGLFLNSALLYLWKKAGISPYLAPLINVLFTTPINYLLSKKWVFRERNGCAAAEKPGR